MRVLIVTQYYHPENFKSTDVGEELVRRGHHVDALVGIPNYPEGSFFKGYGLFKRRRETVNGVNIYRAFQLPRGKKATNLRLALNYMSYVLFANLWVLFFFVFKKKYDAIFVFQTSPITQALPAVLLKKIRKIPLYLWVLDIWPDSVVSSLSNKDGFVAKLLHSSLSSVTEHVYKNSNKILVTSPGMMPLVNRVHDFSNKLVFFPNWCEDILQMPLDVNVDYNGKFVIMMAGNIADGIGIPYLLPVLEEFKDDANVLFVFVGGGAKEEEFREIVEKNKWENVLFTGQVPFKQIPSYYRAADVMLLSLKKTNLPHLKVTIPGRLQSYMAAGKPVIAMIDEGARELIEEADCGFCVPAGESNELASLIRKVIGLNRAILNEKGRNGRIYFEKHFTKKQCISNLEKIIYAAK